MNELLTRVHLYKWRNQFNHYVRFGRPKGGTVLTINESYEFFTPGAIFGYIQWKSNDYGTEKWRFVIVRSGEPEKRLSRIPGIEPGAEVLADVSGKERVHRLFEAVDQIEALGIEPSLVAPWFWTHANASINTGIKPQAYTLVMHKAHLQELEVRA